MRGNAYLINETDALKKLKESIICTKIFTAWEYRGSKIILCYLIIITQHYPGYHRKYIEEKLCSRNRVLANHLGVCRERLLEKGRTR